MERCDGRWQGETCFFPRTQGSLNDIKWYPIFFGKDQRMQRKHVVILRDFVYNSAMCVRVGNISFLMEFVMLLVSKGKSKGTADCWGSPRCWFSIFLLVFSLQNW